MFLKGAYAGYSNTNAAADKLYVQGNYPAAAEAYLNIIKNNNSPTELNETNLALAYLDKELGDYKNSILFFKRYLAVCVPRGSSRRFNTVAFKRPVPKGIKSDSRVKLALAEVYYLNGEDKRALVILKELMSRREDYLLFLYLGLVNEDLGRTARALKYYRQCLKLRVNSIALYRMGKIFYLAGEYPKAINYFKELVKFDASIRLAYYYLGAAYLKEHEFIDAYRSLSRARMFYPGNADISSLLAYVKISLSKAFFLSQRKKIMSKRQGVKLAAYSPPAGNIPIVRIAVVRGVKSFSLKSGGIINLNSGSKHLSLKGDKLYTIKLDKGRIYLAQYQSAQNITVLNFPLTLAADNYPFYVLGAVYGKGKFYQSILDISLRGSLKIILHNNLLTVINILSLEDYLYGVLGSEIYPDAGYQAQKAQAVAARTIAFKQLKSNNNGGFDLGNDFNWQVYRGMSGESLLARRAVDATRGEVMFSAGNLIEAFYHANCGGCLRADLFRKQKYLKEHLDRVSVAGENQLGGLSVESYSRPYFSPQVSARWFKSYPDYFCAHTSRISNFRWQRIYDAQDFLMVFGFPLQDLESIHVIKKGQCEHLDILAIKRSTGTVTVKGDLKIRQYFDNLKSSAFKIEIKYKKENGRKVPVLLMLWGAGFGHGEGMCQDGAAEMAKEGLSYYQILKHYYKGIEIKKAY